MAFNYDVKLLETVSLDSSGVNKQNVWIRSVVHCQDLNKYESGRRSRKGQ